VKVVRHKPPLVYQPPSHQQFLQQLEPLLQAQLNLEPDVPDLASDQYDNDIPLSSFTLIPNKTDTPVVLQAERQPGTGALEKGNSPSLASRLFRYWPLALLVIVWLFLAVWFVIAQRQMD
jgi:hypothetical protein